MLTIHIYILFNKYPIFKVLLCLILEQSSFFSHFLSKNNKNIIKNYSSPHNHTIISKNINKSLISILKSIIIPFSLFFNL